MDESKKRAILKSVAEILSGEDLDVGDVNPEEIDMIDLHDDELLIATESGTQFALKIEDRTL